MSLRERAQAWLEADPDPETRAELARYVAAEDEAALRACFEPELVFGTAGLRGEVGPGPARMNRAMVRRVAWALGSFIKEAGLEKRPVLVGYDARSTSRGFAEDMVQVLAAQSLSTLSFPEACPTPWVAFACRALQAAAGVVVTASHNPRGDNGIKVYDDRGIQIIAPWDSAIAALLEQAPPADRIPLLAGKGGRVPDAVIDAYFAPWEQAPADGDAPLRVAYTPLHGVGLASIERVLVASKRAVLVPVAEQARPDGSFPGLDFPNPEEPGVLDALLELAAREDCDLALANDPDADRLAVCIPDADGWRRLSGDDVGVLLASHLLREVASESTAVVASSIVSSPMLDELAEARGARVERSLTGFKWLCRVPEFLAPQERFVLGYEEALGYAVDERVRDKDGISAAAAFVDLARALRRQGSSVAAELRRLHRQWGPWVSRPRSVRLEQLDAPARMAAALARLRAGPPEQLAGLPVTRWIDYRSGAEQRPPFLGSQDLMQLELGAGAAVRQGRVLVRPSGTEPKVKLYVHLRGEADAEPVVLEARGDAVAEELRGRIGL